MATKARFICITNPLSSITNTMLKAACEARGVEFFQVRASSYDASRPLPPADLDMMYCVDTSRLASRMQHTLMTPTTATLHLTPEHMFFPGMDQPRIFTLHGIPTPKTVYAVTSSRDNLRRQVSYLGGFPIVLKVGGSYGVGVMKVETWNSLFSVMDYVERQKEAPFMSAFIDHKAHYRLVVVGDKVVAGIRNVPGGDDFRSNRPGHATEHGDDVNAHLRKFEPIAVEACKVLHLEFGGVDIITDDAGNPYVTEVNFPCYFARTQQVTGVDVSLMMIDHLIDKAKRLNADAGKFVDFTPLMKVPRPVPMSNTGNHSDREPKPAPTPTKPPPQPAPTALKPAPAKVETPAAAKTATTAKPATAAKPAATAAKPATKLATSAKPAVSAKPTTAAKPATGTKPATSGKPAIAAKSASVAKPATSTKPATAVAKPAAATSDGAKSEAKSDAAAPANGKAADAAVVKISDATKASDTSGPTAIKAAAAGGAPKKAP